HRTFNRHGELFDVGETFAGVPFEVGLEAVEELRPVGPDGATMAQFALRWILMHDAVSTVIPGARNPEQARAKAAAAALPPLDGSAMAQGAAALSQPTPPHRARRWMPWGWRKSPPSTSSGSRRTCISAGSRSIPSRS